MTDDIKPVVLDSYKRNDITIEAISLEEYPPGFTDHKYEIVLSKKNVRRIKYLFHEGELLSLMKMFGDMVAELKTRELMRGYQNG